MKQKLHFAIAMLLTLFAVTITSCGSDQKDEPDSSNPLIGTWEKGTGYECSHNTRLTKVYEFKKDGTGSEFMKHNNNGTKCSEIRYSSRSFKWSSTPVEIFFILDDGGSISEYYTISGNALHLICTDGEDHGVFVRQ